MYNLEQTSTESAKHGH